MRRMNRRIPLVCSLLALSGALLVPPDRLRSDPLVIVRAMTATTIAEMYVEPDSVVVELEIGLADLDAFRNLMPDQIFERLGHEAEPLRERLGRFFREDLTIAAPKVGALPGRVVEMTARPRLQRDEITGEALPVQDEEAEPTVFAKLVYHLPEGAGPEALVFSPPSVETLGAAANVGFAVYHRGVPVNDFRYLGQPEIPSTPGSRTETSGASTTRRSPPTCTWSPTRCGVRSWCGPRTFTGGSISVSKAPR
jgi:hypothetical protein